MFTKLRAWFDGHRTADKVSFSGTVIDKKSYGAGGEQNQIPAAPGKFNGRAAEGVAGAWLPIDDSATWNLIVRAEDGRTKTIFVDENTYNNTEIGDKWPSQ